jgi:ATP-binding cassette, subfamily C (CFTR/MRP), member 4
MGCYSFRLDCTFIITVTILSVVARLTHQNFSTADIALTLSYSLNLMGLVQWMIRSVSQVSLSLLLPMICFRQSVEVESQMTSVERVLEYCKLDQEPPAQVLPKFRPPYNWPSQGGIKFKNVSMSHLKDPNAPHALKNITLTILPHEKIGIVGRTGAGKSSFIQTLFRMGKLVHGQITIDHIDISTIGLDDLRRRISIIPQDPVLFTGTMRNNLDQFGDYSDAEIWYALEQVSSLPSSDKTLFRTMNCRCNSRN